MTPKPSQTLEELKFDFMQFCFWKIEITGKDANELWNFIIANFTPKESPPEKCEHSWIQNSPIKVCFKCGYKPTPEIDEEWEKELDAMVPFPDRVPSYIELDLVKAFISSHKQEWIEQARRDVVTNVKEWLDKWPNFGGEPPKGMTLIGYLDSLTKTNEKR